MIKKVLVLRVFSNGSFYLCNSVVLNLLKNVTINEKDFKNLKLYEKKKHSLKKVFEYEKLKYRNKIFNHKIK